MEKLGSNPVNTKPFWNKINTTRGKTIKNDIPVLIHEDKKFINDDEKANLFAHLLKTTFSDTNNDHFDVNFKNRIDSEIFNKNFKTHEFNNMNIFVKEDLEKVIKKLKTKSTPGKDKINNMMLLNTSSEFRDIVLHLINLTVKRSEIPQIWKESIICMIPKKNKNSCNPKDYRPISLTSCLAKLCESLISIKLKEHLNKNNLILK
jgi:hypothetical protein